MSIINAKLATITLVLCLAVGGAQAQVTIVDDLPGGYIPIPDGIDLLLDDDETAPITTMIGNSLFPIGTMWVGSNGGVGLGAVVDDALPPANESLPSANAFGGSRAALLYWTALWDDLDPGVLYAEKSDRLIIEWNRHVSDGPDAGVIQFQLHVFADPGANPPVYAQFIYNNLDAVDFRGSPTIGYQVGDGVTAVEWPSPVTTGVVLSLIPEPAPVIVLLFAVAFLRVR